RERNYFTLLVCGEDKERENRRKGDQDGERKREKNTGKGELLKNRGSKSKDKEDLRRKKRLMERRGSNGTVRQQEPGV
ncbi:hypothetical protein VIGAN_11076500, partial [Vigna angularis var. angularis]